MTIYEIGTSDSTLYIAMELVLGKTLREVLQGAPLPVRRILDLGFQMADGLAKAHAAGIVHRDIKPENVMVSRDGSVKILDFGLAKLLKEQPADESSAPTAHHTVAGTVLGTLGYMSPSRRAGRPSTSPPTSSRSARSSTRWPPGSGPSSAARAPRPSPRSSGRTWSRSAS